VGAAELRVAPAPPTPALSQHDPAETLNRRNAKDATNGRSEVGGSSFADEPGRDQRHAGGGVGVDGEPSAHRTRCLGISKQLEKQFDHVDPPVRHRAEELLTGNALSVGLTDRSHPLYAACSKLGCAMPELRRRIPEAWRTPEHHGQACRGCTGLIRPGCCDRRRRFRELQNALDAAISDGNASKLRDHVHSIW
jgi:hypothetical protein